MSKLFSRIIVGVDGSATADVAVSLAARLAREHAGELILCHAVDWMRLVETESSGAIIDPTPIIASLTQQGEELIARAAETAKTFGVEAKRFAREGRPAPTVLQLAGEENCSLIVVGTHGRHGLGRLFLGSTTEAILRASTIPVLTVRSDSRLAAAPERCFERVVVGIDDSEPSDAAAKAAFDLPPEDRRELLLCGVADADSLVAVRISHWPVTPELHRLTQTFIENTAATGRARGVAAAVQVVDGDAATELLAAARQRNADLLVVGSHGRRGLGRLFLGSVAESIVRTAPIPVLVVRTMASPPVTKLLETHRAAVAV